jgi:hypothetical protein
MNRVILALALGILLVAYSNCMQGGFNVKAIKLANQSVQGTPTPGSTPTPSSSATPNPAFIGTNIVPIRIGGCGTGINQLCATVRICVPGTSTCQDVPNILVDTGSTGLRLFSQALTLSLTTVKYNSLDVAECAPYSGASAQWGSLKSADVLLGGEKASAIPVQIIDSTFPGMPSSCAATAQTPASAGYAGVLGIGVFIQDCGLLCQTQANQVYYTCSGTTCTAAMMPTAQQVTNPITALQFDNNGVIVKLPDVPAAGAVSIDGQLILGIGTQTNNTLSGIGILPTDTSGNFKTTYKGTTTTHALLSSGSHGNFFNDSSIALCSNPNALGYFCPTASPPPSMTATQIAFDGTSSKNVTFTVMNGELAIAQTNPNFVFNNVAGTANGIDVFDWGLPFFLGKSVHIGFLGKATTLGTGPFVGY